jgi:hypothetical protein
MRRILAAVALCAAVFGSAACTGGTGSTGSAASASPSVSSGAAGTLAENSKQVCAEAKKITEDNAAKVAQEIPKAIQSGGDAAVTTVKGWLTTWATGLRTEGARALDPELKSALTDLADAIDEFSATIKTVNDLTNAANINTPKFKSALEKLDKICGT